MKLTPNLVCEGFNNKKGAGATIAGIGTFVFTIEDDEGQYHTIKLPNSLYIPSAKGLLLCPQHWAQEAKDHFPSKKGTGYAGEVVFGFLDPMLWTN